MALELAYTSSPKGLRLGASGFCTVACTRGMAANYVDVLESLSGYAPVFPPHHPQAALNPVAWSHCRYMINGRSVNILSRVAFAGVDYTQRTNKLAYHLVLDSSERAVGGPAWMMQQPRVMWEEWTGEPRYLERPRQVPNGDAPLAPCRTWDRLLGDGGWAAVLAQAFMDEPEKPAFLLFEPGMPSLALVAEALHLVPAERRWDVTFNTYFNTLPMGTSCVWRFCLKDSPALKQARRTPGTLLIDLTARGGQNPNALERMARGTPSLERARTGVVREMAAPAAAVASPGLQLQEAFSPANLPPRMSLPPNLRPPRQGEDTGPVTRGFSSSPARRALVVILAGILLALLMVGIWFWLRTHGNPAAPTTATTTIAPATLPAPTAPSTPPAPAALTTPSEPASPAMPPVLTAPATPPAPAALTTPSEPASPAMPPVPTAPATPPAPTTPSTPPAPAALTTPSEPASPAMPPVPTAPAATPVPVTWEWFDATARLQEIVEHKELTTRETCRIYITGLPREAHIEGMGWWGKAPAPSKVRWNAQMGEFQSSGAQDDTSFVQFLAVRADTGCLVMEAPTGVSQQITDLNLPQMAFLQLRHENRLYDILLNKRAKDNPSGTVILKWNMEAKEFIGDKSIQDIMTNSEKIMPQMTARGVNQKDDQISVDAKLDGNILRVTLKPGTGKPDCGPKREGRVELLVTANGTSIPIAFFDLILTQDATTK